MLPPRETMIDGFLKSDPACNGRFLVGVVTTGIYCLPTCRARKPNLENVRFFSDESAAQAAGLRPCLRCRPDDFYRGYDPEHELVTTLFARLRADPAAFPSAASLVRASGVGASKLHELTRRYYHASPATLLRRERIRAACEALLQTRHSILDVAMAAGFESASSFHRNFRFVTGMAPGDYRGLGEGDSFAIALPANYLAAAPLRYMGRDAESPTERVRGSTIAKALMLRGAPAIVEIELGRGTARVRVTSPRPLDAASMSDAHRVTLRILGLPFDPTPFESRLAGDAQLAGLVAGRRGLRVPQTASVFEALVWAVAGQQVNLTFAYKLRRAVVTMTGQPIDGMIAHPDAAAVAALDYTDLTSRQYSRRKAEYLVDTARAVADGSLAAECLPSEPATVTHQRLLALRGFGEWSANYVMMRGCGFADCLPLGDTGLTSGLQRFLQLEERPDAARTKSLMEPFAPFRSIATLHLWMIASG